MDVLSDSHANVWLEGKGATTDRGTIGGVAGGVGLDGAHGLVCRVGWGGYMDSVFVEHESCGETFIGMMSSWA